MGLTVEKRDSLQKLCCQFRKDLIEILHAIQTGHPGGSLSATEIMTTLYFDQMNIDPQNPTNPNRDRFVLSKGHAAPMLYLVLAERGYFPKTELKNLRQINCMLQGHPCAGKTPGVELSTGALGLGLSAGLGMALAAKLDQINNYTYVLLGDGEIQEGLIWEAAMSAVKFKADNLIAILDYNGVQLDGTTEQIMPMGDLTGKWQAFGWHVIEINGHNVTEIAAALEQAKQVKGQPTIIIARTVKGKGVSFMEGQNTWHGKPINDQEYQQAISELGGVN